MSAATRHAPPAQEDSVLDGDVRLWIDQEAIHIKALDVHGDPVELTGQSARTLAAALVRLAEQIGE